MKANKAPGPDWIRMELWKWLSHQNRLKPLNELNDIYTEGVWDEHLNYANVVSKHI